MTRRAIPRDLAGASATVALATAEIVYDDLTQTLRLGNGSTPGGIDLANTKRSSLLTAAQYRKLSDKAQDRFDLRDVIGTDVTGNNSSRAALQKAFDQAFADGVALYIPTGKIVADSTITVTNGLTVLGDSMGLGRAVAGYTEGAAVGPAARIHFAHGGEGIRFQGGPSYDGVLLRDLMFTRDQPQVYGDVLWEPNDHDYDLVMFGMAGLHIENVLMLNPTRGINMLGGGNIGRLFTKNLRMQAMVTGINVELAADSVECNGLKFWPYWRDHKQVNKWTINNSDSVWLKRCDTPMFSLFASIAARSAFRIGTNDYGGVTKMKVSTYDIDYSQYGIWFDETSQNCWARFTNGTIQANNSTGDLANVLGSPTRQNLRMDGTACYAAFNGLEISGSSHTAMDLGEGNRVEICDDFWVQNYGEVAPYTAPCINVGTGSTLVRTGRIYDTSGPGGAALGPLIAGAGTVMGIRKAFIPGAAPAAGAYTTMTLIDSEYIEDGYRVSGAVNIRPDDVGTGTGALTITAPTEIDISTLVHASNSVTGEILRAITIAGNPGSIVISKPGGGNVAVNGQVINISFDYNRKAS